MAESVRFTVDGESHSVAAGITVAAALARTGNGLTRRSLSGQRRMPVCGMGVCFECRVVIDGRPHQRACQILIAEGMRIDTVPGGSR